MKNRDLFFKDPTLQELLNDGVAKVLDSYSPDDLFVLRQELETFVCEGEYAKGLEHILRTFLSNLDKPKQPSVWVSGFFGSGKSHLVKMARALWVDVRFPDGATARGLAKLNDDIKALLIELSNRAKTYGGLHAASGTLGAGAGESVRLTLLDIIFRSKGLPPDYPQARFVMWLKQENVFEKVKAAVEAAGKDWQRVLGDLHVSPVLAKAILEQIPGFPANDHAAVGDRLETQFPLLTEITDAQMHDAMSQALTVDGSSLSLWWPWMKSSSGLGQIPTARSWCRKLPSPAAPASKAGWCSSPPARPPWRYPHAPELQTVSSRLPNPIPM